MATYYLDIENGNDANDGTTFANRWKTINSGATSARIAPGDTIRVMKSPDPTSLGIDVTFTNNSPTLTLASALTSLITDCNTAWTNSANVTCTTNATRYLLGTGAAVMSIAAGFATGKVAYLGLGSAVDFSAYQGITFGILCNNTPPADGTFELRLCSDTVGNVAVDTFVITGHKGIFTWERMYYDKGAALGASIQSIALYATADPGTIEVWLDNINATKAAGNDCLNLTTLIGKNNGADGGWYPIRSINGTSVIIDTANVAASGAASSAPGFYGTTSTETGYIRKPIRIEVAPSTAWGTIQDTGTVGNLITFSGGWNTTDMSTQTGDTYVDSGAEVGYMFSMRTYTKVDKINPVRFNVGFYYNGASNWSLGEVRPVQCQFAVYEISAEDINVETVRSNGCTSVLNLTSGRHIRIGTVEAYNCAYSTSFIDSVLYLGASSSVVIGVRIESLTVKGTYALGWSWTQGAVIIGLEIWAADIQYAKGSGNYGGMADMGLVDYKFGMMSFTNNSNNFFLAGGHGVIQSLTVASPTQTTSLGFATYSTQNPHFGIHRVLASSISGTVTYGNGVFQPCDGWVFFRNYNGVSGDHRGIYDAGLGARMYSETGANRHTASGVGWRIDCLNADYDSTFPIRLKLASVVLEKDVQSALRLFVNRSSVNINARLCVYADEVNGVSYTSDTISVAAGSWEELSLLVTPTEHEMLDVWLEIWGGSTHSIYFDDLSIV